MNKHLKKFLLVGASFLMIMSSGSLINNSTVNAKRRHIRTHRVSHHRSSKWHYGVPKAIKGKWMSNFIRTNYEYKHGYMKNGVSILKNSDGFNPFPYWYNSHKHFKIAGATNGEFWDPHYKYIGKNYYLIRSGKSKMLHKAWTMEYVIKEHNHNHFSAWQVTGHHLSSEGYFHRINHFPKN